MPNILLIGIAGEGPSRSARSKGHWQTRIELVPPSIAVYNVGMDENEIDSAINRDAQAEFQPARFQVELGLPYADEYLLNDAKAAVRQEYRDCSKWKRLRCRKVSVIAERDRGTIYAVHVGSAVEFDWTWEGAVAFRPSSLGDDPQTSLLDFDYENAACEEENLWSGEILEVDERNGCLFISLSDPERPPTVGSFFVRPFEFLEILDSVYHDPRFEAIRAESQVGWRRRPEASIRP